MRDLRGALRSLRRTPGFTVTAILTLALGIGLSTAVFTVADALLLRPLPFQEQERLVALWGQTETPRFDNYPLDVDGERDFARQTRTLERVAYFAYEAAWPTTFQDGDHVIRLRRGLVSGNFFDVLGSRPVLGRSLHAQDDVLGAAPVVVLGHAAWRRLFGEDPGVVGRQLLEHATGRTYTIVGVMPPGLELPRGADVWAALVPARTQPRDVDLIGRLRLGVTPVAARDELTAWFARTRVSSSDPVVHGFVQHLPRLVIGDARPAVIAFTLASGLLLLITCINVANLLFVRGVGRMREIAVRSSLGAGRWQIVAQLLAENAVLALAGGTLGLAVASATVRLFVTFAPAGLPRLQEIRVDSWTLAGTVGITGVAMLIFGIMPAIITSHMNLEQVLRSAVRHSASRRSRRASEGLVAGQVALAVLMLSAAGLITGTLLRLERADLSFEPSRLAIAELSIRYDRFDTRVKQLALLDRLIQEVQGIRGVRSVSPVVAVPFAGTGGWDGRPAPVGQPANEASTNPMLNMDVVSPDYFATFGIPVVRGRGFTTADREDAPAVVMLSESAARRYWPGADAIGKRLVAPDTATVIGIVPDTRYRDLRDARASIYFPLHQSIFPFAPTTLAIRTSDPIAKLVPALRRAVGAADPAVTLAAAAPFETYLEGPLAQPRLNALLLVMFALAAVVLAAVGLYGVMASAVRERTREIGVRAVLGATPARLRRAVLGRALTVAGAGAVIGLGGALATSRLLGSLLFEVSPTDPVALLGASALLLAVAVVAAFVPARRATKIDPAQALRAE